MPSGTQSRQPVPAHRYASVTSFSVKAVAAAFHDSLFLIIMPGHAPVRPLPLIIWGHELKRNESQLII
jgi:hypothetical protein